MITFHTENWATYFRDCQALWAEHYDEIAVDKTMVMKPDVAAYQALERVGQLDVLVAREAGRMVGYVISAVRPHMHYADTLCGFEDAYYLTKDCRRGMAGVRLIQAWDARMAARGCWKWFIMTKPFLDIGPLLKRIGYVQSDTVWAKTRKEA